MGENMTTKTAVGSLPAETLIYADDSVSSVIKRMVNGSTDYFPVNIGTWNTQQDVDTFFALHNHNNNYKGLALGNCIRINDGTYNVDWEIAGFDMESNRVASDGTTYDNGYGICLIPKTNLGVGMKWNSSDKLGGAYMASLMHTSNLVTVANNLQSVLGSHLINRNVLLSSGVNGSGSYKYRSNAYTWTTSYATLMSAGQLTGTFKQNWNIYDDGEANYKLPLFDHEEYKTGYSYWLRGAWGFTTDHFCHAWSVYFDGSVGSSYVEGSYYTRPLIYLR